MLGSLLCLPGSGSVLLDPYGSTISETTSEAWSVEVLPSDSGREPGSFCRCQHPLTVILLSLLSSVLHFISMTVSNVCLHAHVCIHAYLCLLDIVGVGTPGVFAWHSIPKMCACICHHICAHLPVFQGRSACASKRQLRVSLEGPPGVFAPAVEQWGGKRKDSSCPQSVYVVSVFFIWLDLTLHCSQTGVYILYCYDNNSTGHQYTSVVSLCQSKYSLINHRLYFLCLFLLIEHTVQTILLIRNYMLNSPF